MDAANTQTLQKVILAAGWFWGVEEDLQQIKGVTFTEVGYTGGTTPNATYQQVCGGHTGHCEAVLVKYDTSQVSLDQILKKFWQINPAYYPPFGKGGQYRSAIFYFTEQQKAQIMAAKAALEKSSHRAVFTEITEASPFWRAEEYHQNYNKKNHGGFGSCGKHW